MVTDLIGAMLVPLKCQETMPYTKGALKIFPVLAFLADSTHNFYISDVAIFPTYSQIAV